MRKCCESKPEIAYSKPFNTQIHAERKCRLLPQLDGPTYVGVVTRNGSGKSNRRSHATRLTPIETRVRQEYADSADNEPEKAEGVDPVRDADQGKVARRIQNLGVLDCEPCNVSGLRHC